MIAIIDSVDRAGKTTLCDYLKKQGFEYFHFEKPKGSPYAEYRDFIDGVLAEKRGDVAIDRFMYSEVVYAEHYKRLSDLTMPRLNRLEQKLLALPNPVKIVNCAPDVNVNWKLIQDEGKGEFKTIEELFLARNHFLSLFRCSPFEVVTYDWTKGGTPEKVLKELRDV